MTFKSANSYENFEEHVFRIGRYVRDVEAEDFSQRWLHRWELGSRNCRQVAASGALSLAANGNLNTTMVSTFDLFFY